MKNRTILLLASTFAGGILLTGCGNSAEQQADKMEQNMEQVQKELNAAAAAETRAAYERERSDALDKLYTMRENIDRELLAVNERLANKGLTAGDRAEQEALRVELESQQAEVGRLISTVEGSQQGTWISVKEETRTASEKIEDWWKRTKDNVDAMTRSDKDKDGK